MQKQKPKKLSRLQKVERLCQMLGEVTARLYGLPKEAVKVEVDIFRSQEAFEEAKAAGWTFHEAQECEWYIKGEFMDSEVITIHRGDYRSLLDKAREERK